MRVQPGDDLDQRRLAGAVVAQHAGDLAGVDREVDALRARIAPYALPMSRHLDQRLALVQGGIGVLGSVSVIDAHLLVVASSDVQVHQRRRAGA